MLSADSRDCLTGAIASSYRDTLERVKSGDDFVNKLLYLNARTYLLDDLNVKMDRASMAVSLEGARRSSTPR